MNSQRDPNIQMVEGLVVHLAALKEQFVLVGGCATGLLITDRAVDGIRPTNDIDLVVRIMTMPDYYQFSDLLRAHGFSEDKQSDVVCRWKVADYIVDVMPSEVEVLGFSNQWYPKVLETYQKYTLPSQTLINLISAPLFLATKIDAFEGRGGNDFQASHDIEDIITVLNGREEITEEVAESDEQVVSFLQEEFDDLLGREDFVESIAFHLAPDKASQDRRELIVERMRKIAGL